MKRESGRKTFGFGGAWWSNRTREMESWRVTRWSER